MKDRKRQGLTHSQTLGIIWLSVGLVVIAGVAFFSSRRPAKEADTLVADTLTHEILTLREDSVYRSRRQHQYKKQPTNTLQNRKPSLDSTFYSHTAPTPTKQPLRVELNSADTLTLQLLHGIGPTFARRIATYRSRLGGFVSTDQLLEVYGFTPELLNHIAPSLTLDTANITRIDINNVELKQLARHPYVEYYQARDIVRLRQAGRRFHSADDLRAIPSMADSTLQRLLPYLDFGEAENE